MPNIKEMSDDEFERCCNYYQALEGDWEILSPALTITDQWEYPSKCMGALPPRALLDGEILKVGSIIEVVFERVFMRRKLYRRWREGVITGIDFSKGKMYISLGDPYSTSASTGQSIILNISDSHHEALIRWPVTKE